MKYFTSNQSVALISNTSDAKYIYTVANNINLAGTGNIKSDILINRYKERTFIYYSGPVN